MPQLDEPKPVSEHPNFEDPTDWEDWSLDSFDEPVSWMEWGVEIIFYIAILLVVSLTISFFLGAA